MVCHPVSDGVHWVWKRRGEPPSSRTVIGTLKYGGGSIMAWGCLSKDGVVTIQIVQGNMDASQYDILAESLPASLRKLGDNMDNIIFQEGNDPKHTSNIAKEHFASVGVQVLAGWPP